jgi:hypothetical protein
VISTGRGVSPRRLARAQRKTLVSGMLVFVVLIVLLQLWLLTATMNAFLGGDTGVALPAALASAACFGLNLGLLRYLFRFE